MTTSTKPIFSRVWAKLGKKSTILDFIFQFVIMGFFYRYNSFVSDEWADHKIPGFFNINNDLVHLKFYFINAAFVIT